jgi:hypothetical protein
MEEDYLDYTDLVLLYHKGFTHEVHGTLWGYAMDGVEWAVLPEALGGYLLFHQRLPSGGLSPRRTMTREQFTEIFG